MQYAVYARRRVQAVRYFSLVVQSGAEKRLVLNCCLTSVGVRDRSRLDGAG